MMSKARFGRLRKNPQLKPTVKTDVLSEISSFGLTWIHYTNPGEASKKLLENYGAHQLDIEDVFSKTERPKIEVYPDYLFLVFNTPYYDRAIGRVMTGEIDIFVRQGEVISFSHHEIPPLLPFIEKMQKDPDPVFSQGSGYLLYKMMDHLVDFSFPMVDKIGAKISKVEDKLFEGQSEAIVKDLSFLKQEIIAFRKTVRPQRQVLRDMEKIHNHALAPGFNFEIYFGDILDAEESLWDTLENYREVIAALEETNESPLDFESSKSLKALTAITVIVLPLTLIASIWGMNVNLPGGGIGGLETFAAITISMAILLIGQILFFRWRKWL